MSHCSLCTLLNSTWCSFGKGVAKTTGFWTKDVLPNPSDAAGTDYPRGTWGTCLRARCLKGPRAGRMSNLCSQWHFHLWHFHLPNSLAAALGTYRVSLEPASSTIKLLIRRTLCLTSHLAVWFGVAARRLSGFKGNRCLQLYGTVDHMTVLVLWHGNIPA